MDDKNDVPQTPGSKIKMRSGSGYLRQLYTSARTTAGTTHSHFKNLTTFLVNFIPLDKIDASELQVRTHFDDQEVLGLAKSVKEHGVLQPILVVQNGDRYKVIAGERRVRASKLAGLERIPARVITSDDKGVHEIALRENLDRVDLHPIEEGEGYVSLLDSKAYASHEAIAEAFVKPKSRITECIGFTRLPDLTKKELLQRGMKQRALLRRLLNVSVETHLDLIKQFAEAEERGEFAPTVAAADATATEAARATPTKRAVKPFEYKVGDKGFAMSGFRWKRSDGNETLQGLLQTLEKMIADLKARYSSS